jgi:hypothetical protein
MFTDLLAGIFAQQSDGNGVVENSWRGIKQLMGCAQISRRQGCSARFLAIHLN